MAKRFYYLLLTIAFGLIYLPDWVSILTGKYVSFINIDIMLYKALLLLFASVLETFFMQKKLHRVIGRIIPVMLLAGIIGSLSYQWWSEGLILISGITLVLNLLIARISESENDIVCFAVAGYVLIRILTGETGYSPILWWAERLTGVTIMLLSMWGLVSRERR